MTPVIGGDKGETQGHERDGNAAKGAAEEGTIPTAGGVIAGVHIRQYQRLEYGERSVGNVKMRFGLAVCAILEIDPFELVPWFPEEWQPVPLEDE